MPIAPPTSPSLLGGVQTPNVSGWYSTSMVSQVPEEAVAFMLAQGYEITNIQRVPISNADGTDIIGDRAEYSMTRTSLNNGAVVGTLISSLSSAFQQGRAVNEVRYQNIVAGMSDVLASFQADTKAVADGAEVDGQFVAAINDLDTLTADAPSLAEWTASLAVLNDKLDAYDAEVEALIASYEFDEIALNSAITEAFAKLTGALGTYRAEVAAMKGRQSEIQGNIATILSGEISDLANHATELNQALDALDDQYDTQLQAANNALTAMDAAIGAFSSASDSIVAGMESSQAAYQGTLDTLLAESKAAIQGTDSELTSLLGALRSGYAAHAAKINPLVAEAQTSFNEKDDALDGLNGSIQGDFTNHAGRLNQLITDAMSHFLSRDVTLKALAADLRSDHASHAGLATGFLDNLGNTERARINEQFDNLRVRNNQLLVSRGLYSSAIVTQMEAQVERERAEALITLNDRLNREKWENQHRLYEQLQGARGQEIGVSQQLAALEQQTIQGRIGAADGLHGREQAMRGQQIDSTQRSAALQQQMIQARIEATDRMYARELEMRGVNFGVVQQFASLEQQSIQFRTEATDRLNARSLEISRLSLQAKQEAERIRTEMTRLKVSVSETFARVFTDIKSQVVDGLTQLQQSRVAVSRGQAEDYNRIFSHISETFARSLAGEDRFASLDAQLRGQQQSTLAQIEQIAQAWAQTQGRLLETGVAQRGNSANVDAQVRSAYYDVLVRQKTAASDSRVRVAVAKGELLTRHIDEASKIAVSLYGFMERREDPYPGVGSMAQTAASLAQPGTAAWRG